MINSDEITDGTLDCNKDMINTHARTHTHTPSIYADCTHTHIQIREHRQPHIHAHTCAKLHGYMYICNT